MTQLGNAASLRYFLPESILTLAVLVVLVLASFPGKRIWQTKWAAWVSVAATALALLAAAVLTYGTQQGQQFLLFNGLLSHDPLAMFFKLLFLVATLLTLLFTMASDEVDNSRRPEYYLVLLAVCLGMCLVGASKELIMIYLALEMFSIGSYVLVALTRNTAYGQEGGMKFVLYGGVSTGLFLYGLSLLYGMTGTTDISLWQTHFAQNAHSGPLVFIAFLFILAGIGYKLAAVPFHFWCPDVYEGAPTPITAFLSVASNTAGFALLIRFSYTGLLTLTLPSPQLGGGLGGGTWTPLPGIDWVLVLTVLAIATMTLGNLGAMSQNNMKRFLAYSGIAQGGYMLLGAIALSRQGLEAMLFYFVVYMFTNLTAFLVVIYIANTERSENIAAYRGLAKRNPWLAGCMGLALISLTGIPPTAGFAGKFYLFYAALGKGHYWLVLIALLNTVVSLYYYARILRAMYLETSEADPILIPKPYTALLLVTAAPILLLFIPGIQPLAHFVQACASIVK